MCDKLSGLAILQYGSRTRGCRGKRAQVTKHLIRSGGPFFPKARIQNVWVSSTSIRTIGE